jgi:very-short-patch-repair endonuclease
VAAQPHLDRAPRRPQDPLRRPIPRLTTTCRLGLTHSSSDSLQLIAADLTADEIRHRLESGGLLREHWGVYRVGHRAPSLEARYLAAVLACGEDACLSGRAAAHLLGLLKGPPPRPEVGTPVKRRANGVKVRRSRIDARDRAIHRGIPITAVPRTLIDLAADLPLDALARACHEAGVRYNITPRHLAAALARRPPNTPGTPNLKRIINGDARVTLSALERRFLKLLRDHQLPLPQTNRPAGSHRVDCRWPGRRLTVELDSYRFHHSRHAWEQDRRREREARARGDDFRRYTWADVFEEPEATVAELRAVLIPAAPARSPPRST